MFSSHTDRWLGPIAVPAPRLGWVFATLAIGLCVSIVLTLLFGTYVRRVHSTGQLVPSAGLAVLRSSADGTVHRILVREGDPVSEGQPLVEVSLDRSSLSFASTHDAITQQLNIQKGRLEADILNQQRLSELHQSDLTDREHLIRDQEGKVDHEIAIQRERAARDESRYDVWEKASRAGIVSQMQLAEQYDRMQQQSIALSDLQAQRLQLERQASEVHWQLRQLPDLLLEARATTERALADVNRSIAENAAQASSVVHASTDGLITNINVHPGQTVRVDQLVVTIAPSKSPLIAELWLPTKDAGFVKKGEAVILKYDAYPYQRFGQFSGGVEDVSISATAPKELEGVGSVEARESSYRVDVYLNEQEIPVLGQVMPLRPGMTLTADIVLGRARFLDLLTTALSPAGSRAGMSGSVPR